MYSNPPCKSCGKRNIPLHTNEICGKCYKEPVKIFIKFSSHRSREYGLRTLGGERQAFYSLYRETGRGCYQVEESEIAKLTENKRIHFSKMRAPFDDLHECINFAPPISRGGWL